LKADAKVAKNIETYKLRLFLNFLLICVNIGEIGLYGLFCHFNVILALAYLQVLEK